MISKLSKEVERPIDTRDQGFPPAQIRTGTVKEILAIYKTIPRPLSLIIARMRAGKIGLRGFLHDSRIPGYEDPQCPCR
jgi:hypothetical protein